MEFILLYFFLQALSVDNTFRKKFDREEYLERAREREKQVCYQNLSSFLFIVFFLNQFLLAFVFEKKKLILIQEAEGRSKSKCEAIFFFNLISFLIVTILFEFKKLNLHGEN